MLKPYAVRDDAHAHAHAHGRDHTHAHAHAHAHALALRHFQQYLAECGMYRLSVWRLGLLFLEKKQKREVKPENENGSKQKN